jgi:tetratricopeptide (TPR) repeat protein
VLAESAELVAKDGSVEGLTRSVELWREAAEHHPDAAYARAGLAGALALAARQAALAGDRVAAAALMSESVGLDPEPESDSDPDRESDEAPDADPDADSSALVPARISASLLAYVTEDLRDAPFPERMEVLRLARSFDDSPEVRGAMCGQMRAQAALLAEAKQMVEAERLLHEALELAAGLAVQEETTLELAAVYRAHAIEASASRRRRREAAEAIRQALELLPDSEDLQAVQRSIEPPG